MYNKIKENSFFDSSDNIEIEESRIPESYYLNINIDLPDRSNELINAENKISQLRREIILIQLEKKFTENHYFEIYNKIIRYLEFVGFISIDIFNIRDIIEKTYIEYYKSSDKQFIKKLWYQHYSDYHKPYTTLKNQCYKLISLLDKKYKSINKKLPLFRD